MSATSKGAAGRNRRVTRSGGRVRRPTFNIVRARIDRELGKMNEVFSLFRCLRGALENAEFTRDPRCIPEFIDVMNVGLRQFDASLDQLDVAKLWAPPDAGEPRAGLPGFPI